MNGVAFSVLERINTNVIEKASVVSDIHHWSLIISTLLIENMLVPGTTHKTIFFRIAQTLPLAPQPQSYKSCFSKCLI
jgi:hypothetical protein